MHKKISIIVVVAFLLLNGISFAAKIPNEVKSLFKQEVPSVIFRFDGLVMMPDETLYLPLFPALVKKPDKVAVAKTYPENKKLKDKPDIIILNNDFAFLKVITDYKGNKTVVRLKNPPLEVKTGLLPQDLLVPSGLVIPENIKGIIGNLHINTSKEAGLKITPDNISVYKSVKSNSAAKNVTGISLLKNKMLYIATCYSKNIQVVSGENSQASYALEEKGMIIDMKATPDERFLLVTVYGKNNLDVISLADDMIIRQIDLTTQGEEIVIDEKANKAYISSSKSGAIFVFDISTMKLVQKINVKGKCEKLTLADGNKKLIYSDKRNGDIWVIELDNDYLIQNIGSYPGISCIRYANGKIYVISRVKNRLAVIDYVTTSLITEKEVSEKPVDMLLYGRNLFVLSAQNSEVAVFDILTDEKIKTIKLNTDGFSTRIHNVKNTNIALVTDTKINKYGVIDLNKKELVKINILDVPVSQIAVVKSIPKINR